MEILNSHYNYALLHDNCIAYSYQNFRLNTLVEILSSHYNYALLHDNCTACSYENFRLNTLVEIRNSYALVVGVGDWVLRGNNYGLSFPMTSAIQHVKQAPLSCLWLLPFFVCCCVVVFAH